MMLAQLRRELAIRSLAWWLPIAALAGVCLWGTFASSGAELKPTPSVGHPKGLYPVVPIAWMALCVYLLNAGYSRRCSSRLDMVLPLDSRRLWLTHAVSVTGAGFAIVATAAGIVVLGNALVGKGPLVQPGLVSLAVHFAVGFLLAFALLQSPRPRLYDVPRDAGYLVLIVVSLGVFLGLTILLSTLPRLCSLVPLGVALVLLIRVYCLLPRAFTLVPRSAVPGAALETRGATAPAAPQAGRAGRFWVLQRAIWWSTLEHYLWVWLPVFAFHGFVLSQPGHEPYFSYFFLSWIMLASLAMIFLRNLHRLDPLPVSRGRFFASLTFPALLAISVGYGCGRFGNRFWGQADVRLDYHVDDYYVRVPTSYWEIAWDGKVPAITSPWGETRVPGGMPLLRGSRIRVYNPYDACCGSQGFAALQLSRAVRALYGKTIDADEIRRRQSQAAGLSRGRVGTLTLLQDHPDLRPLSPPSAFPMVLVAVGLPWLLYLAIVCRVSRADIPEGAARWAVAVTFGLALLLGMGSLGAHAMGLVHLPGLSRLVAIVFRQLGEEIPGGAFTVWAASALLLTAGYQVARAQFRRMEAGVHREQR